MNPSSNITICVNGESFAIQNGACISDLLKELKIGHPAVAVEINEKIRPRSDFDSVQFKDGDVVEVVSLVGGG